MDPLDTLLSDSAPHVAASQELTRITRKVTTRTPRRALLVAGLVVLSVGGTTAAMAGTGTLDDIVDFNLGGAGVTEVHNDHAWEMDITGTDGTFHCFGGIVVMRSRGNPDYDEEQYLAIKQFVQDHNWSDLQPDPSLLQVGQEGTAEQLAITADRQMIVVAQDAGFGLGSISTRGFAQCEPK